MSRHVRLKECPECRSRHFTWNARERVSQCRDCGFETAEEDE